MEIDGDIKGHTVVKDIKSVQIGLVFALVIPTVEEDAATVGMTVKA